MPEDMPLFMRVDCHDDMLDGGLTVEEVAKNIGAKCILVTTGHQNRATLESVNVPVMDSLMESLDLIYERDKD